MSVAAPPSSGSASSADRPRGGRDASDVELLFRSIEPVPERVPLPAWGTGRRSGRRRQWPSPSPLRSLALARGGGGPRRPRPPRPDRRPHRSGRPVSPRLLLAVGAAVVLAAWLVSGGLTGADRPSVTSPPGGVAGPAAQGPPVATLLVVEGVDGTAAALTVLVAEPDGGGALVYVPTGTMLEVPSFGLEQVGQSVSLGGLELVRAGLENLFGVEIGGAVSLAPSDLGSLVADGELVVDVPETVEARTPEGRVQVVWPEGPVRLTAADAATFLTERGDDTELGMLVRHHVFWAAVLSEAKGGAVPRNPLGPVIAALAAGNVAHHTLPVESIGPGAGETDLYRVDRPATAALVERVMAEAPPVEAVERTRVQVLNGTGEPGLAREVTAALVPAGAEVVVVGNADRFDHTVTQVVFYDREEQARAEAVRDALGAGEVVFSRHTLDVVDVTVVVGSDFAR